MSAARTQTSQTFSYAKSTVLAGAGVQDAYWSDDEDEDAECPLCMEEMDVAEMGFRPCPCGYQICMFCYHHIKNNLNGRCPACRREYLEENVQFTAVAKEDLKRQNQQKKRKERERKELEALGRRHFANVRVVQRNVVYVVGLGSKLAKEELIPTLRSNEYFGQYGKISKIILAKRNQPGFKTPVVGLYITYHRREDATRAINSVDGSPSPGGGGDIMKASYGTTKYCMSFLRGLGCSNPGCWDLHEWGDKNDCFTKEDLATLKHSLKDTENHLKATMKKKGDDPEILPRNSWVQKPALGGSITTNTTRQSRVPGSRSRNPPLPRGSDGASRLSHRGHDRRAPTQTSTSSTASSKPTGKTISQLSISRPTTPAAAFNDRPSSPPVQAVMRARVQESVHARSSTPASSAAADSDVGSSNVDIDVQISPLPIQLAPAIPPGLPLPPSYQISTQAQALLDDVRTRRDNIVQVPVGSPFPEFDRTLDNLGADDFQWSLDPKFATSSPGSSNQMYKGPFDPFSASDSATKTIPEQQPQQLSRPPGLLNHISSMKTPGYQGPFNPFADSEDQITPQATVDQEDTIRQESRFGFARRRASPSVGLNSPSLSSVVSSPVSVHPVQYQLSDTPWSYMGTQPGLHEYNHRGMGVLQNTLAPIEAAPFHDQRGAFPPGLRFRPFDNVDNDRPFIDSYQAASSQDPASQASISMGMRLRTELSGLPSWSAVSTSLDGPPGLSPRGSTPSSVLSPIYSEQIPYQPTPVRASLPSIQHGSSVASSSAHVSPQMSPAPLSALSAKPLSQTETILLAADFPALPVSSAAESQSKREQTQPYIQPPPKPSEPKASIQASTTAAKKPKPAKDSKSLIISTSETPVKLTDPHLKSSTIVTPLPVTAAHIGKKTKRKQEKKEEPKPTSPQENERPSNQSIMKLTTQPLLHEPVQEPLFSKVSKKTKPIQPKAAKSPREGKDESLSMKTQLEARNEVSSSTTTSLSNAQKQVVSEVSYLEAPTSSATVYERTSLRDLLDQLSRTGFNLSSHAFFDTKSVVGDVQTPLQYDPLVHALSALSVGGGSFANNLPAVSIDSAVSSFQQLLETLTQTISDLLRLLPRTTWDDSSSFDGVLRDMLKGDDFLDDAADEGGREDEVAALTLALERRARWMEVQLAKLEELHRDINMAAVRAVLTYNDRGWDPAGFMPRSDKSLSEIDNIGVVWAVKGNGMRKMPLEELQRAAEKANFEEKAAKRAVLGSMIRLKDLLPVKD